MAELDRIYQHLVWQQNPKNAENALSDMQNAAESVYPSLEYIRNAKGFHQP
ncbi:hypothetical protein [Fibrobacter sp. UWB12]|uniref:hypothetical protein n=1 Tax=Fibrobacter sp. UWB12 TaxID=1896203 RepID=UPI0020C8FBDD|nr:hypothetical protein [Fibrobacter sp. UWB12]